MDKTTIDELIGYLKQSLHDHGIRVESIILFGSALKGKINAGSDIDLIVISPDFRNLDIFEKARMTMGPEIETLRKFQVPMDIVNLSPEEYQESNMKFFKSRVVA